MDRDSLHFTGEQMMTVMQPGVYFWKRGEQWLYIGSSANILWRVSRHNVIGRVEPMEDQDVIGMIQTDDYITLEASMIATHRPKYNIVIKAFGRQKERRVCPACRIEFMQNRPHQIWCSKRCAQGTY